MIKIRIPVKGTNQTATDTAAILLRVFGPEENRTVRTEKAVAGKIEKTGMYL